MDTVIFVSHPDVWRRAGAPGGIALLARQLKQLRALGHAPPVLLVPRGDPVPELPDGLAAGALVEVPADARTPTAALQAVAATLPDDFLFLAADRVVDRRVLEALAAGEGPRFACGSDENPEPIARLGAAVVRAFGDALTERAARLSLATIDPYTPELRGAVAPYVLAVRTDAERRSAGQVLLDHAQKRCLDLPGQYFDTPFENALVRRLAPTSVTPNQVTLATLLLAGVVGVLFLHGWLRIGILLALVVGILDGVDGKLARVKLATSKLGELEHVGDFFYENFWYLMLGAHLQAATGLAVFWHAALAMVALDLCDSMLYGAVRARTGRMLDELSSFDRAFRRVAGRRNVYVWILIPGVMSGHAGAAFLAASLWAALTVWVHAMRAAPWLKPRRQPRGLDAQVSESEPSAGVLVSER